MLPDKLFLDKAKITINGQKTNTAIFFLGNLNRSLYFTKVNKIRGNLIRKRKRYEHFEIPIIISVNEC